MLGQLPRQQFGNWQSPLGDAFQSTAQAPSNLSLAPTLSPQQIQQQAAAQAGLQLGGKGLVTQGVLLAAQGGLPQQQYGVTEPRNIASSAAEGVANGINNYLSMRQYGQRVGQLRNLAQQYQVGQQQQVQLAQQLIANQLQLQQQAAQDQNNRDQLAYQQLQKLNPGAADAFAASDRSGRDAAISGLSNYQLTRGTAAGLGEAQGENKVAQVGTIANAAPPAYGPNGLAIPNNVDTRQMLGMGSTTPADIESKQNQLQLQRQQIAGNNIDLQAKPQEKQQELAMNDLKITDQFIQNNIASVDSKYKEAQARVGLDKGILENKKAQNELNQFNNGMQIYNMLKEKGALDSKDPVQQAENAALLNHYGIPWKAPDNSKITMEKLKNGKSVFFNHDTGQVAQYNGDGTTGAWQDIGVLKGGK